MILFRELFYSIIYFNDLFDDLFADLFDGWLSIKYLFRDDQMMKYLEYEFVNEHFLWNRT